MTTQMIIAQCLMVLTLVIMITGMTPIYITAITGAAISAIVAGFPLAGSAPMTIAKMINSGLNPVIADMTGILLFIGNHRLSEACQCADNACSDTAGRANAGAPAEFIAPKNDISNDNVQKTRCLHDTDEQQDTGHIGNHRIQT